MNISRDFHFNTFAARLRKISFNDLPGLKAQLQMAPLLRRDEIQQGGAVKKPIKSSVMILLYPAEHQDTKTVFIQRPHYDGVHAGQISFPGGRIEPGDATSMDTALRETHEEIGVDPSKIEVIGQLTSLYIPPSNHLVDPFVGICLQPPKFIPDKKEVEHILEIPVKQFFRQSNIRNMPITLSDGRCMDTPCYHINGYTIWGATAMIVSEFLAVASMAIQNRTDAINHQN